MCFVQGGVKEFVPLDFALDSESIFPYTVDQEIFVLKMFTQQFNCRGQPRKFITCSFGNVQKTMDEYGRALCMRGYHVKSGIDLLCFSFAITKV